MEVLRIPDKYRPGLVVIARLSDESVEGVRSILGNPPPRPSVRSLASSLVERLPDRLLDDSQNLARALISLYALKAELDVSAEEIADRVSRAMGTGAEVEAARVDQERPRLRQNLLALLSVEAFQVQLKKSDLSSEYEHTFCTARILTDIRPVFGSDPSNPPVGAILVHTLKLTYHEAGEQKDIYIAMDSEGIATLRGVLERAERKASSLGSILRAVGMQKLEEV